MRRPPPRPPLTQEDEALWRSIQETARPLETRRAPMPGDEQNLTPLPTARPAAVIPVRRIPRELGPLQVGQAHALGPAMTKKIKRGELPVDRRIDLHGFTLAAAHSYLQRQCAEAITRGERVLLIITGRGTSERPGKLREALPGWLNEETLRAHIIAVVQAAPAQGGPGAFTIVLKRPHWAR